MILEAGELIAIQLIRIVATLIDTITNGRGMYTLLVAALILSRLTVEGWTRLGLIAAITTIILRIAAPIERNAFVCVDALKVGSRAIGPTCASILGKHKVIGTGALVVGLDGRQETQRGAIGLQTGITTDRLLLPIRMEDTQIHWPVYGCYQCGAILSIVFIAILNRFGLPVRPIDAILPHSNRKDMMQI